MSRRVYSSHINERREMRSGSEEEVTDEMLERAADKCGCGWCWICKKTGSSR